MSKIITNIVNGKPDKLEEFLQLCAMFDGKKVDIDVNRHKDKRTNPQNRYWRGVVIPLITSYMNKLGNDLTEDEVHDFYKSKGYFGYKDVMGDRVPKGSSECSTIEMAEAKERVQREWAERGLDIPNPNEEDYRIGCR